MKWVAPRRRAWASLPAWRSTARIGPALTRRAPWMMFRPMPPQPKTATLAPGVHYTPAFAIDFSHEPLKISGNSIAKGISGFETR